MVRRFSDDLACLASRGESLSFVRRKGGGDRIAVEARNGGRSPAEDVRLGGGDKGVFMGADCDLACSSFPLPAESRLS